jgi:DNA uptake protein ComE-like DNA-binding protein
MRTIQILALLGLTVCAGVAVAQVGNNQGVSNPNLAGESELEALPGLDVMLAAKIVENRPLSSAGQLGAVLADALSDEEKATLYSVLFVPINLNSAAREEIMLVPGINRKMAHEFEEYRPYESMSQFRREIGKYVDETEVARLEQYVFVPMALNTASGEDFATIPGMSRKMVREFEEYRPYTSIEQFRREMGKYVDEDEVARLERYIEVN